jgi:hypothetical protein
MSVSDRNRRIKTALNDLMKACGYSGESGTEALFDVLFDAVHDVRENWDIVEESHEDGLGFDVNSMLADHIEEALLTRDGARSSGRQKPDHLKLVKA